MKEKSKKYIGNTLGISMVILGIMGIFSVIAIFGGGIMKIFGFEYQSVGHVILFFVITGVLSFSTEMLAKGFANALLALNKINIPVARVLFVGLDMLSTGLSMYIVDYFMNCVSATPLSIFVISFLFAILSVSDIKIKDNIKP